MGEKNHCHKNRVTTKAFVEEINLYAEWEMQTAFGRSDSEDSKTKGSGTGQAEERQLEETFRKDIL